MTTKPTYTEPEAYKSQYGDQIASGIDKVTNREAFTYDPLKDANYQAMAKIYNQQGEKAAKNTLGDAAALNGGFGSSYAVTASQQVRNDYNQQLASQIPALQEMAYGRYKDAYDMDVTNLQLLQDADDVAYGRYRDDVADGQWKHGTDYQAYRDDVADTQWKTQYDRGVYESDRDYKYQKERDKVSDSQWAKEYALAKKTQASSGGSSGGGYLGPAPNDSNYEAAKDEAESGNGNDKGNGNKKKINYENVTYGIWDQFLQKQKK